VTDCPIAAARLVLVDERIPVRFAEVTNTASSSATTAFCMENTAGSVRVKRSRVVSCTRC
jgi:hypothetical protein